LQGRQDRLDFTQLTALEKTYYDRYRNGHRIDDRRIQHGLEYKQVCKRPLAKSPLSL